MSEIRKPRIFITQPMLPGGRAVLDDVAEVHQNSLGRPLTEDEMVGIGRELNPDAYIGTFAEPHKVFGRSVIEATPNLKVIGWNGLGFDHIDLDAATENGIYVTSVDRHCATVSDQALALLLAAARRVVPAANAVREGRWEREGNFFNMEFTGTNLHDQTVGIVGLGRIGGGVARRVAGFDTRILYHDAVARPDLEASVGATRVPFERLLAESDFVVCCAPLNAETYRIFDAAAFARMKSTATFVNVTRGGLVDTDALTEALRTRRIEMAALDVIDPEPLPADHPILKLDNVILVPHIAGITRETRTQSHVDVAEDTLRVLGGRPPRLLLNPAVQKVRPLSAAA